MIIVSVTDLGQKHLSQKAWNFPFVQKAQVPLRKAKGYAKDLMTITSSNRKNDFTKVA